MLRDLQQVQQALQVKEPWAAVRELPEVQAVQVLLLWELPGLRTEVRPWAAVPG